MSLKMLTGWVMIHHNRQEDTVGAIKVIIYARFSNMGSVFWFVLHGG